MLLKYIDDYLSGKNDGSKTLYQVFNENIGIKKLYTIEKLNNGLYLDFAWDALELPYYGDGDPEKFFDKQLNKLIDQEGNLLMEVWDNKDAEISRHGKIKNINNFLSKTKYNANFGHEKDILIEVIDSESEVWDETIEFISNQYAKKFSHKKGKIINNNYLMRNITPEGGSLEELMEDTLRIYSRELIYEFIEKEMGIEL